MKEKVDQPARRRLEEREVYLRAQRVFSQLGKWISTSFSDEDKYWTALGRQRRKKGFALFFESALYYAVRGYEESA